VVTVREQAVNAVDALLSPELTYEIASEECEFMPMQMPEG